MTCPYCDSEQLKVVHTDSDHVGCVIRNRKCLSCGKNFQTIEAVMASESLNAYLMRGEGHYGSNSKG